MPRLKPDTQRQRRENILDAAERSFARSGFHATSMQDICREAGVSPGALYLYFSSKEALIAGIAERDRLEFQSRFAHLAETRDFLDALRALGESYFVDDSPERRLMCIEIALEATRNPQVGEIHRAVDAYVEQSFEALFERLKQEGRIQPDLDIRTITRLMMVIGDGMFLRRAVSPNFDPMATLEGVVELVRLMIKPTEAKEDANSVARRSTEAAE